MKKPKVKLVPIDRNSVKECQDIVAIVREHYPKSRFPPDVREIAEGKIHYFKAFIKNEYVGITGFYYRYPTMVETVKTIVLKEFRGKGYGKLLSQAIEDHCIGLGVHKITTAIYSTNYPMLNIKMQQGYTIEGYHPHHEEPGIHEYSLGKVIKEE